MLDATATTVQLPMAKLAELAHSDPPPWASQTLQSVPKDRYLELKQFLRRRHRTNQGVIALDSVNCFISGVGDLRLSWSSLLRICDRQQRLEPKFWSGDHWLAPGRRRDMAYVVMGDDLLVSRGLYKTALARYALHYRNADTLYGVEVSRWSIDWTLYETWLALRTLCAERLPSVSLTPQRRRISQERAGNWVVDEYLLTLRREDKATGKTRILGGEEAGDWLAEQDRGGRFRSADALHASTRALAA